MKTIHGDLIRLAKAGQFDVIVHGCNCFCTMGRGIAKSIREEFPEAYAADQETKHGDRSKLGSYSEASIALDGRAFTVINAYTQYDYRGQKPNADYDAIRSAFRVIKQNYSRARIGYPLIGAGLAGGNWAEIAAIIEDELAGEDHTLVIYEAQGPSR
jgi:O-acetyl-ADP-ribose deacetylase (regulator of RNase III)